MYKCKGIVSITSRNFSAFPYSICSQTKTPLMFVGGDRKFRKKLELKQNELSK